MNAAPPRLAVLFTNVEPSTKAAFTLIFAISAVIIQSMQQDIKWKLD